MAIILDADAIIKGEKGTFDLRGWFDRTEIIHDPTALFP
jgi:hypothetical protein